MGTVFQSICAEISSEFETLLSDNSAMNFLERVCDMTGTLMISKYSNDNINPTVAPNSLKICGSWISVCQTHNILSAYTIVRGLMKTDIAEKDKNVYDDIINDYIPSAKRKRGRPAKIVKFRNYEMLEKSTGKPFKKTISTSSPKTSENLPMDKDHCEISPVPVPVLLTISDNNQSVPVLNVLPGNQSVPVLLPGNENSESMITVGDKSPTLDKQYESNMYFVENPEGLVAESQNIDNHSNMDTEDNKDIYSCAMCRYTTTNARNLEAHLDRFHFKPVTCHICGRGFGYERDLKRHLLKNKYSCGSRRSVINENYIKISTDTDDQINMDMNSSIEDQAKKDDKHLTDFLKKELNESNQLRNNDSSMCNSNFKIKEEPVFLEDQSMNETDFPNNVPINLSLPAEKATVEFKIDEANTILKSRKKSGGNKSSDGMSLPLEDPTEDSDSYQPSLNIGYQSSDADQYTQNDQFESIDSNVNLSVMNVSETNFLSNIDHVDNNCDDDFIVDTNSSGFACKYCTYTANKRQHIVDHICRMHKKQFSCDHCHSMFGLVKDLNRHLRRSHGIDIPLKNSRGMVVEPL